MLEEWAKFAGFSAILAVAIAGGLTWALPTLFPPDPAERAIAECSQLGEKQNEKANSDVSGADKSLANVATNKALKHENASNEAGNELSSKYECLIAAYTRKLANFTYLLTFVTAILIAVGIYQGSQLKRSVDVAERATVVTERAYVSGGPGHRGRHRESNGNLYDTHIIFTGMNTGKTPAFTKRIEWGVCKESDWPTVGKNWPAVESSQSDTWENVLQPQMNREELVQAETTATFIEMGEEPHVCWGRIFYRDIFGNDYETAWKHQVVRKNGVLVTTALPGAYSSEWEKKK
jgi:hypothetical protein